VKTINTDTIKKDGIVWTYSKPFNEVWRSVLKVVKQYEGIISLNSEKEKERFLLFIHGEEMPLKAPAFKKNEAMKFNKFLDIWIAVIVQESNNDKTAVIAAYVSPEGKIAPIQKLNEKEKSNQSEQSNVMEPKNRFLKNYEDVHYFCYDSNKVIRSQLTEIKDPIKRWEYVPQAIINEFYYHLGTQLFCPKRWKDKFFESPREKRKAELKIIEDIEKKSFEQDHLLLAVKAGNWMSAKMRRYTHVVNCPEITLEFEKEIETLKSVTKEKPRKVNIYIISSPELNAFAIPNGDIFICSGLLESLDTKDQVMAVLAHEFDHLINIDTITKIKSIKNAKNTAAVVVIVGAVAAVGATASLAASAAAASAAAGTGTSVTSSILSSSVSNAIQMCSGIMGQAIGAGIISGYSQEIELRADYNGARYIWAAGYDIDAELKMLEKLKDHKTRALERNETISSGLINCEPGLDERIEKMKIAITKIRNNSETDSANFGNSKR